MTELEDRSLEQSRELKLLLDIPSNIPVFGFNDYASILVSAIINNDPHFSIGIIGKWGSGKTTLLNTIRQQLKSKHQDKVVTVYFDAWRYQREQHMILPILDTLILALEQSGSKWQGVTAKVKKISLSMLAAVKSIKVGVPDIVTAELDPKEIVEQWEKRQKTYKSDYFDWINRFQTIINDIRDTDKKHRIVILIDDLDRCLPNKVVEVLESIKVMLDLSGIIFVFALDETIVQNAIDQYYGQGYGLSSKDYIKKIIQVEFRLPPIRKQDVVNYVKILHEGLGSVNVEISKPIAQIIPVVVGDNPREIKRFINSILITMAIIEKVGFNIPVSEQISYMAMEYAWPVATRIIATNKGLRLQIRKYVDREDDADISKLAKLVPEAKRLLDENSNLEAYLKKPPGNSLLDLSSASFTKLIYYSSIVKEPDQTTILRVIIERILNDLPDRDRRMLCMLLGLYGEERKTEKEIAQEYGIRVSDVKEIILVSLRKLRHPSRSRKLRDYLSQLDQLDNSSRLLLKVIFGEQFPKS